MDFTFQEGRELPNMQLAQVPFYCDGEQHQLFPGIDLNCVEACNDDCPDDCCDKPSCCDEEECIQSCDLLCDGYVHCDHPPDCVEAHCDSPNCEEQSSACFDENCLSNAGNVEAPASEFRKKRRLNYSYNIKSQSIVANNVFAPSQLPFVFSSQGITNFMGIHEPTCFGHNEACPPGCVNPMHLQLQPSLCQHIPPSYPTRPHTSTGTVQSSGDQSYGSQDHSPRQGSVVSTPYWTPSESRPSTSCSMLMEYHGGLFPDQPLECCCVDANGVKCGQIFADTSSLNQHILDNHVRKTRRGPDESEGFYCCWFDCSRHLNNQPFTSIGKIESHYLSHSGHKGWKCEICGRIYAREGSLDRHRRTHSKDKIYKCEVCGKSTTDKNQLKIHMRSHTGEKPYKCDFPGCDHRASDSTNMTKHKKTHQPRQYYCPYSGCNRMFVRSDGLKRHMKTCKAAKDFEKKFEDTMNQSQANWPDRGSMETNTSREYNRFDRQAALTATYS